MKCQIHRYKTLESTQDKAKEFIQKGLSDIIIVADNQTKGRGRFKRKWHSSKDGLWFSIVLKPDKLGKIQLLTFAAAIAVVKSIKKIAGIKASIKWPNDVHYKGRKVCGILTEGVFGKDNYAILGIGLNLNQKTFPKEVKNMATSLKIINGKSFDKGILLKSILSNFTYLYQQYYKKNRFNGIFDMWKKYSDTINKDVVIITKNKKINGTAVGINNDCSLQIKLRNGKSIKILEGDVSVRY